VLRTAFNFIYFLDFTVLIVYSKTLEMYIDKVAKCSDMKLSLQAQFWVRGNLVCFRVDGPGKQGQTQSPREAGFYPLENPVPFSLSLCFN